MELDSSLSLNRADVRYISIVYRVFSLTYHAGSQSFHLTDVQAPHILMSGYQQTVQHFSLLQEFDRCVINEHNIQHITPLDPRLNTR